MNTYAGFFCYDPEGGTASPGQSTRLNDVEDVERHLPGLLRATNEWFRIYKIPDGKPENQFAFSGECKNKKYAMDIVRECAEAWEKLVTGKTPKDEISL